MARYDDLDTNTIAMSAVISTIVLIVLILGGRALSSAWKMSVEEQVLRTAHYRTSEGVIANQKAQLSKSGEVVDPPIKEGDPPTKRNLIPIEKAQQIIAQELSVKPRT